MTRYLKRLWCALAHRRYRHRARGLHIDPALWAKTVHCNKCGNWWF